MKTPCSLVLFAAFTFAVVTTSAHPMHRHLQNQFPTGNNQGQGPFGPRPVGGPTGALPPQFGGMPMPNNGLGQFPVNGQMPVASNFQNNGPGTAQTLGAGEADVAATGSAAGNAAGNANAAPAVPGDSGAATTDLAPGQPTIMVILPDAVTAHSGWSSFSGDVGESTTKPPQTDKPADADKPAETSAAPTATAMTPALALLTTALSMAAVLGASYE